MPVGLGNIYFPLIIGSSLKVEPEFGLLRLSEKATGSFGESEVSSTLLRLGLGVFWITPLRGSFRAYVGPRVGIVRQSSSFSFSSQPEQQVTQTHRILELATGGEHLFSSHFSLGGEVRLSYITAGEPKETPSSPNPVEQNESIVTTNALILLRWYF